MLEGQGSATATAPLDSFMKKVPLEVCNISNSGLLKQSPDSRLLATAPKGRPQLTTLIWQPGVGSGLLLIRFVTPQGKGMTCNISAIRTCQSNVEVFLTYMRLWLSSGLEAIVLVLLDAPQELQPSCPQAPEPSGRIFTAPVSRSTASASIIAKILVPAS